MHPNDIYELIDHIEDHDERVEKSNALHKQMAGISIMLAPQIAKMAAETKVPMETAYPLVFSAMAQAMMVALYGALGEPESPEDGVEALTCSVKAGALYVAENIHVEETVVDGKPTRRMTIGEPQGHGDVRANYTQDGKPPVRSIN